jgi:hypothetical protein
MRRSCRDPELVVVDALRERLREADLEPGIGIAERGDVRDDPSETARRLVVGRELIP